jgi:hypothetical protein
MGVLRITDIPVYGEAMPPNVALVVEDTRNVMGLLLLEGLHAFETGQVARNRVC